MTRQSSNTCPALLWRFLGLHLGSKVPDATNNLAIPEDLIVEGIIEELFDAFDAHLRNVVLWP